MSRLSSHKPPSFSPFLFPNGSRYRRRRLSRRSLCCPHSPRTRCKYHPRQTTVSFPSSLLDITFSLSLTSKIMVVIQRRPHLVSTALEPIVNGTWASRTVPGSSSKIPRNHHPCGHGFPYTWRLSPQVPIVMTQYRTLYTSSNEPTSTQEVVHRDPPTNNFRRLEIFSLSSLTLSAALAPFTFVIEATGIHLSARFALAGVAVTTSDVSTALVAWCGSPYVTKTPAGREGPYPADDYYDFGPTRTGHERIRHEFPRGDIESVREMRFGGSCQVGRDGVTAESGCYYSGNCRGDDGESWSEL